MPRPKGSRNKKNDEKLSETNPVKPEPIGESPVNSAIDAVKESKKIEKDVQDNFVSMFQAADQFGVTEDTIKLWIDHGHLRGGNGRVSVRSITECRFNNQRRII